MKKQQRQKESQVLHPRMLRIVEEGNFSHSFTTKNTLQATLPFWGESGGGKVGNYVNISDCNEGGKIAD